MILRQYLHTDPVIAASYLFGCGGHAAGAVVDPVGEPQRYLEAGAEYILHASAGARFPFRPVEDGDVLPLGNVDARVLHVPGHTPEHLALLVTDRTRGPQPWFILTGHTLMVGDMGRTELASSAEAGARALFRSAERLRVLPDYLEVLPGAFAGSVCGRGLSGKPTSTIGFERRFNRAFSLMDEEPFVRLMLQEIPPRPERAREIRAANLGLPLPVEA